MVARVCVLVGLLAASSVAAGQEFDSGGWRHAGDLVDVESLPIERSAGFGGAWSRPGVVCTPTRCVPTVVYPGSPAAVAPSQPATVAAATPGASAYDIAVAEGFVGSQAAWLESLRGPPGPPGPPGPEGSKAMTTVDYAKLAEALAPLLRADPSLVAEALPPVVLKLGDRELHARLGEPLELPPVVLQIDDETRSRPLGEPLRLIKRPRVSGATPAN